MFSLVYCTKDVGGTRPYPRVQTLEVTNISESGAVFNATISNDGNLQIIEHGFVWGNREDLTISNANKRVLTNNITNNEFSAEILTTLTKDQLFFVRAYLKTDQYLVYGKPVTFVSLGSTPVVFDSFSPRVGKWGDTIHLKGKYFSFRREENNVRFKDLESRVLSSTDSTITCIVPRDLNDQRVPIYIEVANEVVKSREDFELLLPRITAITPIMGTFRDTITISGENFSRQSFDNQIYFGNIRATVVTSNANTIKVLVPDDLESSSEAIKVISDSHEATYDTNFSLMPPVITFVAQGIFANNEATIQVNNFHPILSKNIVTIEDIESQIISGGDGTYTVKVPWGPFPRRKAKIKIQVLDLISEYEFDVDILDKWIMVADNLPFNFNGNLNNAVVAQGTAYIIAKSRDFFNNTYYLWKFNSSDLSWRRNTLPFTIDEYWGRGVFESDGTNLFVYLPNDANDFWKYDPLANTWTKKSSFIGNKRGGATHFSIDGNIYIGLGIDFISYPSIDYSDFYKYNPANDQWARVSDVPISRRLFTASFVINGIGYFTGGAMSSGDTDAWSYNPITDTWARIADNPYAFSSGNTGFSLGGFGYVIGSGYNNIESWKYDPVSNVWQQSYNIGKSRRDNFVFSLNGKAYIGGGSVFSNETFEFVP
ncbi:MAG TPA: hypothetical protein ENK46_08820 [Flavobacteriia bacterium]|nr:hypothetical protein [Flavobacteriia bacterium]